MVVDISQMERYEAPVSPALYPQLSVILLGIGLLLTSFIIIGAFTTSKNRNFLKQIVNAFFAAAFLGFGSVFLLLWVGIYI
ncbi:unnamed protein product [Bursaphelenchus okinawaensis]|uniref:Dolichyl-diphosphooligosaccharide-protein glycosyltransferase subunit TMEM258 n=1 Tax=Bursaphelenchus okinawaensis TaxID=465554 RepID=A0A811LD64_9BILA|nr:unnamed protein product [Bursaphelenchus okinawaensis]CAG9120521.1 unnamed protein product [Bursaphelenchus okinawaensis]